MFTEQSSPNKPRKIAQVRRSRIACHGALLVLASLMASGSAAASDSFLPPTREELAMKSVPGYPGAPAVILYREEITTDSRQSVQHYERIKILTEEGKRYANVELQFASRTGDGWEMGDSLMVENIIGRTVEADGRVVPFTGKPYLKMIEKGDGFKFQEKVFTLPEVEVSSIIEYRYSTHYDHYVLSPTWMIQDDLFLKQGHFVWYPSNEELSDSEGNRITTISWFPLLPPGSKIEHRDLPGGIGGGGMGANQEYELRVKDVPPKVKEEYMPPIQSYTYRVLFSFTPYSTGQEYWAHSGKTWSKNVNKFSDPNSDLRAATEKITAGTSTPEEKLKKIYAAVMNLENTRFTRDHDRREDKAAGMGQVRTAADVLTHGRGTPTELTELFVGMARAAGLPAYAMMVPDRAEELFIQDWLSFRQFDDMLAIVTVNGKEQYFDPGSRYTPFGELAWQHTYVQGLRQIEGGAKFDQTPGPVLKTNRTTRVANLTMDAQGAVTGKIDMTYSGTAALRWRQLALRGDEEEVRREMRSSLERTLPKSLEIEIASVKGLPEYEQPLAVSYQVKGSLGTATGKRVLLPTDVFLADEKATFPHEKRETAVYFEYPHVVQDAVRINFPNTFAVEAVPSAAKLSIPDTASYTMSTAAASTSVTTRRDFAFGTIIIPLKEYGGLRSFYSQMESKDQESIVLKSAGTTTASATN